MDYNELINLFKKYFNLASKYFPFLTFVFTAERIYSEKITNILKTKFSDNKINEYLSVLIFPEKPNLDYYEHISFLKISEEFNKINKINKSINEKINKHLERFSRLSQRYGIGAIWTEDDIINRLKNYKNKDAKTERLNMIKRRKENKQETKNILNKFKSDELNKSVKIVKEFVYLRTLRTETISFSYANINNLLTEIGERNNLSFDEINFSTYDEIIHNAINLISNTVRVKIRHS